MTKDNLLFAVFGIFIGFLGGYLFQEVMTLRQPPRQLPGQAAAGGFVHPGGEAPTGGTAGMPPGGGAPGGMPGAAGAAGAAPMAQIQQLRDYVAANPNDAEAVLALANLNFEIRNWGRARELYQQYLGLRPDDPDVMSDLGVALHNLGDHQGAIAQFHKAQAVSPQHWQSVFNEAIVLAFGLERYDEAGKALDRLRKMQPDNPEVSRLADEIERRKAA